LRHHRRVMPHSGPLTLLRNKRARDLGCRFWRRLRSRGVRPIFSERCLNLNLGLKLNLPQDINLNIKIQKQAYELFEYSTTAP
jgi:hypothetical protein